MGQPRRSFTPEFKQEAVDLCRRSGKSECQVARELGIPQPTFKRWMRHVRAWSNSLRGQFLTSHLSSTCGNEQMRREKK
jgi:transposase-like protein